MQDAGEGPAAQDLVRLRILGQQLGERGHDLADDLAALLRAERGRDPDLADEQLRAVAASRAVVRYLIEPVDREPAEPESA